MVRICSKMPWSNRATRLSSRNSRRGMDYKMKKLLTLSLQQGATHTRCAIFMMAVMAGGLGWPGKIQARQNSVNGSLSLGNDFDSNVFNSDADREDEWRSRVAPQLTFTTKGSTDSLALTYAPEFTYNHRRLDDDMAHVVSLAAEKGLSSRWKVTMSGNYATYDNSSFEALPDSGPADTTRNFLRADAATQAEIVRILFPELVWDPTVQMATVIAQLQGRYSAASAARQSLVDELLTLGERRRYWTSEMEVRSVYEFAERSAISLGYRFASQDNHTGLFADYVEQTPIFLLTYQFNQQWRAEVGYELVFTDEDTSDDSRANHPHFQVDFQVSPTDLLFWNYDYQKITFDGATGDTTDQGSQFGWRRGLNPQTDVTATLGTSYLGNELRADEREYSLNLGLNRRFEKGTIGLSGEGITAEAHNAGYWEKSRRSWELGSTLAYQLRQELASSGHLSYGQWDSWSVGLDDSYDRLQLGAGLHFAFMRWYSISLNYDYNLFDTDGITLDDYSEHLVTVNLAMAKELWRW